MPSWFWEGLIAATPTISGILAWRHLKESQWRVLAIGALATGIGLSLAIAMYFWGFEDGGCAGDGAVACRVNGNQGMLTLLTAVLAIIAIWTTALTRTADARNADRKARDRFARHLESAISEARHNLIHIAMAYGPGDELVHLPQVQVFRAQELDVPEFQDKLADRVSSLLNSVVRMGSLVPKSSSQENGGGAAEVVSFTVALLRFLNAVITQQAEHPLWLHKDPMLRDMVAAMRADAVCPFYSSKVAKELPHLRTHSVPVFCWIKDQDLPGVHVVEMKQRTRDYQLDGMERRRLEAS